MTAPDLTSSPAENFSLFAPDVEEDPFAAIHGWAEACPVARSEAFGGYWVVTGYDEMAEIFGDADTFSSVHATVPVMPDPVGTRMPLEYDRPEHTNYRRIYAPLFSPGVADRLEVPARQIARDLLAQMKERGRFDFVEDFAVPQWSRVILGHFVGVPVEDADKIVEWKDSILRDGLSGEPERVQRAYTETLPKMVAYWNDKISEREAMAERPDDLLTGFLGSRYADERPMSHDEIVRGLLLLNQAGVDTVIGALGFAVHWLATHPEQQRELASDPSLVDSAVEEFLRFNGAVVSTARVATRDVEIAGCPIRQGESVLLPTWAAGRDPGQYENPDQVDLRRKHNRHMAFGMGVHRCVGAHIARMELRVILEELHRAIPSYELDPDLPVTRHLGPSSGIDRLPLVVRN